MTPAATQAAVSYLQEFDGVYVDEFGQAHNALTQGWYYQDTSNNHGNNMSCAPPVTGDNLGSSRIKPPGWTWGHVGGDYHDTPWPLGISGNKWWGSHDGRNMAGDPWGKRRATTYGQHCDGKLRSPDIGSPNAITIGGWDEQRRYISFLISGGALGKVSIAFVEPCPPCSSYLQNNCGDDCWPEANPLPVREFDSIADVGNVAAGILTHAVAYGQEHPIMMRQVIWDTWTASSDPFFPTGTNPYPSGTQIQITVEGRYGSMINVDRFMLSDASGLQPVPYGGRENSSDAAIAYANAPLWGFADLHAHWLRHMGDGAIPKFTDDPTAWRDERAFEVVLPTLWGAPWVAVGSGETEADRLRKAIPKCGGDGHNGKDASGTSHNRWNITGQVLLAQMTGNNGADHHQRDFYHKHSTDGMQDSAFVHAPMPFLSTLVQQMYWSWVKRAWQGGLRLMVTDVLSSAAVEILASTWKVSNTNNSFYHSVYPYYAPLDGWDVAYGYARDGRSHIASQACATTKLLSMPELDFAELAYTPAQARAIIRDGKLAVILGSEQDDHGSLRGLANAEDEIAWLKSIGIRKIAPLHMVDNKLGGAAVYSDFFNAYTDAMDLKNDMTGSLCLRSDDPTGHLTSGDPDRDRLFRWMTMDENSGMVPHATLRCQMTWDRFQRGGYPTAEAPPPDGEEGGSYWIGSPGTATVDDNGNGIFNYFDPSYTGDNNFDGRVNNWANVKFTPSNFFEVVEGCGGLPTDDCAAFKLSNDALRAVMLHTNVISSQNQLHGGFMVAGNLAAQQPSRYGTYTKNVSDPNYVVGHINKRALTDAGYEFVNALMRHGMILDIAHAGDRSIASVIGGTTSQGSPTHQRGYVGRIWAPGCVSVSGNVADTSGVWSEYCQQSAYPVFYTHGGFRGLQHGPSSYLPNSHKASERNLSLEQFRLITASGGVIGVGTGHTELRDGVLDCQGSSQSVSRFLSVAFDTLEEMSSDHGIAQRHANVPAYWAQRGIALGTDLNGMAEQLGPRFNLDTACSGDASARDLQVSRANGVRYMQDPFPAQATSAQWRVDQPPMSNFYLDGLGDAGLVELTGSHYWKQTYKGFDFNWMGLANYGLLPDLLQDIVNDSNLGGADSRRAMRERLRFLFRSAEDFISAWEKGIAVCSTRLGSATCTPPSTGLDPATCNAWANVEYILGDDDVGVATSGLTSSLNLSAGSCLDAGLCEDGGTLCNEEGCCRCDASCAATGSCCLGTKDWQVECAPSCAVAGCGESGTHTATTQVGSCGCGPSCVADGNCCSDYASVCGSEGSCMGLCGGIGSSGTCYCDSVCSEYGDCCGDYTEACGSPAAAPAPPVAGSCMGACGGFSGNGCYCDAVCESYGDCCWDRDLWCPGGAALTGGSCAGICGGFDPYGCYCDTACVKYGDCCQDYAGQCAAPSCTSAESSGYKPAANCYYGLSNNFSTCACDSDCSSRGDCCPDAATACGK